jgi:hypothetical protein
MMKVNDRGQAWLPLPRVGSVVEEVRLPLTVSDRAHGVGPEESLPFSPRPRLPAKDARLGTTYSRDGVTLHYEDSRKLYATWPEPTCIISDGAYGVSGFPGDPPNHEGLAEWYRPQG